MSCDAHNSLKTDVAWDELVDGRAAQAGLMSPSMEGTEQISRCTEVLQARGILNRLMTTKSHKQKEIDFGNSDHALAHDGGSRLQRMVTPRMVDGARLVVPGGSIRSLLGPRRS